MARREQRQAQQHRHRHHAEAGGGEQGQRHQPTRCREGNDAPAPAEQPGVLRGDQRDREADHRLDRRTLGPHPAEHGEGEGDAVRNREGRDQRGQLTEAPCQEEQREHERQVVPTREDVLDAEHHVARQRGAAGRRFTRGRSFLPGERQGPAPLALDQQALEAALSVALHPREVHVRRRLGGEDAALDGDRAAGLAAEAPGEVGPALRRLARERGTFGCARLPADLERQVFHEVARSRAVAAHVEHRVHAQPRELEQRHAQPHLGTVVVEGPARVGDATRVGRGRRRRERVERGRERDEPDRHARGETRSHGRVDTTRTSARSRSSSR